ncbi:MAG: hypothetical protein O7F74_01840 [Bacteroidetes bacterium]|nr:hypothetical protein [Bacteroidota bacterium]
MNKLIEKIEIWNDHQEIQNGQFKVIPGTRVYYRRSNELLWVP